MAKKNSMQKEIKKTEKGEQMDLMDTGPENRQAIVDAVREYKKHQSDRIASLKKELKWKDKVKKLILESDLKPLKDGRIKFTFSKVTVEVTPRDELITIKEEKPKKTKKPKKNIKKRVETEEKQFDETSNEQKRIYASRGNGRTAL